MKVFKAFVIASTLAANALAELPRISFCNGTNYCEVLAFSPDGWCYNIPNVVPGLGVKGTYVKLDDPEHVFKECLLWPTEGCAELYSTETLDFSPLLFTTDVHIQRTNWTAMSWICVLDHAKAVTRDTSTITECRNGWWCIYADDQYICQPCTESDNGRTFDLDTTESHLAARDFASASGKCVNGFECYPIGHGYTCQPCKPDNKPNLNAISTKTTIARRATPDTGVLDHYNDTSVIEWCEGKNLNGTCQVSMILGDGCQNLDLEPKSAAFKMNVPDDSFTCKTYTERNCTGSETLIKNNIEVGFDDTIVPHSFSCKVPPHSTALATRSDGTEAYLEWCSDFDLHGQCEIWYLSSAFQETACVNIPFEAKSFYAYDLGKPYEWRDCIVWENQDCPDSIGDGRWTGEPGVVVSGEWNWAYGWTPRSFHCLNDGAVCPKNCDTEPSALSTRSDRNDAYIEWCSDFDLQGQCEIWYLYPLMKDVHCVNIPFSPKSFIAQALGAGHDWRQCIVFEEQNCPLGVVNGEHGAWTGRPGIVLSGEWNWDYDWTPGSFQCLEKGDLSASNMVANGTLTPINKTHSLAQRQTQFAMIEFCNEQDAKGECTTQIVIEGCYPNPFATIDWPVASVVARVKDAEAGQSFSGCQLFKTPDCSDSGTQVFNDLVNFDLTEDFKAWKCICTNCNGETEASMRDVSVSRRVPLIERRIQDV